MSHTPSKGMVKKFPNVLKCATNDSITHSCQAFCICAVNWLSENPTLESLQLTAHSNEPPSNREMAALDSEMFRVGRP